jgi:nitroreductase
MTATPEVINHERLNGVALGDAIFSMRSVRKLRPDPIPVEDLRLIMEAAVRAPNGGNAQQARFLLINDPVVLADMGALYREAWWAKRADSTTWKTIDDIPLEDKVARAAAQFADDVKNVSAMVLAFGNARMPGEFDALSVVPAVENLMLAARALGIGSLPTTLHPVVMDRVYERLSIPPTARFHLLVPLGYPVSEKAFGLPRRRPTSETTHMNTWGTKVPWT